VLVGSALATVLGNIGGAISYFNSDDFDADDPGSLSDEIDDVAIPEFSNFFKVLKGQALGAVSGFLAAELGEALGLDGFGGQLFDTVASRSIGYVLGTAPSAPALAARRAASSAAASTDRRIHRGRRYLAGTPTRSRAASFRLADLSWPHAAMMSRPRGVRTGLA
jgi:hypothetical protein